MVPIIYLILVIILLILNGFFVVAEFALLRIPKTRVATLVSSEGFKEQKLLNIFQNFNLSITSLQLGITSTTLLLGIIGSQFFNDLISSGLRSLPTNQSADTINIWASLIGFIIIFALTSIYGEIIPKILSLRNIENTVFIIAIPVYYSVKIIQPITSLFKSFSFLFLRLINIKADNIAYKEVYSEDELRLIIANSKEEGEIDATEQMMIERIFDFTDTPVKEILTPRYKIIAFSMDTDEEEIIKVAKETGFSRFPVFEGKLDNIKGFIHIKDVILSNSNNNGFQIKNILRPAVIIHEGMVIDILLKKMQKKRSQIAIVIDEYGSVEGLVSIEDVIEEIFGEIDDEFDETSTELVKLINDNLYLVNANITLDQFNESFKTGLSGEDAVTLAGFLLEHLDSLPEEGSVLKYDNCEFQVKDMDGNRIAQIQLKIEKTPVNEDNGI